MKPILRFSCSTIFLALPQLAIAAPPVVASSEETATSICIDFERSNADLLTACLQALDEPGLGKTNRGEVLQNLAYLYMVSDDFQLSEDFSLQAIELTPLDAGLHSTRGWNFWSADQMDEARSSFQLAIDLGPEYDALAGMANILRAVDGDTTGALELLELSLAIEPDYRWGLVEKGWTLGDLQNWQAAEASFRKSIEVDEWSQSGYLGLAEALQEQRRDDEALTVLNTAVEFGGDQVPRILVERAGALRFAEKPGAAIKDAEAAIKLAPEYQWGYVEHARALRDLGKLGRAIEVLETGAHLVEGGNGLYYWLADFLSDDGRNAEAMAAIDRAIVVNDSFAADHVLRAYIALQLDDADLALEAATTAVALDADSRAAHYQAARAYAVLDQPTEAVASFDAAIAAGLDHDLIGDFAATMIANGHLLHALKLRKRY